MLQNWHFQQDLEPSTERKVLPWILAFRVLNCSGFTPICQLDRFRPKLEMSPQAPITSSVQKGSVLWPLIYLIYIKNIPAVIKVSVAFFGDHLLLHRSKCKGQTFRKKALLVVLWQVTWSMFRLGQLTRIGV